MIVPVGPGTGAAVAAGVNAAVAAIPVNTVATLNDFFIGQSLSGPQDLLSAPATMLTAERGMSGA